MKIVLIGQAPSATSDPAVPLSGRSGEMLAKVCGVEFEKLGEYFERANLLPAYPGPAGQKGDKFPMREARESAARLRETLRGRRVVLLGAKVAEAFGHAAPPLSWADAGGFEAALCPHPSGVNLWWNSPANRAEACRFFSRLLRGAETGAPHEAGSV